MYQHAKSDHAVRFVAIAAFLLSFSLQLFSLNPAFAQDRRQNEPGQFDFYVLALSWSPSYCEGARARAPDREPEPQCAMRPYSFVVHGLWPQYEQGFPSFCQRPAPRLDRNIVASMLDLMPSPRLIFHEWDRHGTCTGLSPIAYFENVRKARSAVKIPGDYAEVTEIRMVTPAEVADAFVKANPGLSHGSLAVSCSSNRLGEVRLCLTKEFGFRDCPEVARRSCRRDKLIMPPVRAGGGMSPARGMRDVTTYANSMHVSLRSY